MVETDPTQSPTTRDTPKEQKAEHRHPLQALRRLEEAYDLKIRLRDRRGDRSRSISATFRTEFFTAFSQHGTVAWLLNLHQKTTLVKLDFSQNPSR